MGSLDESHFIVDYLIVGAGFSGLAFVDELLTRTTEVTFLIVDKRDLPGGHWTDCYPFVKLHQAADQYGIESKELESGRIDTDGLNKGLLSLARGAEIRSYSIEIMRDRFVSSGRVKFLPSTEYLSNGILRGIFSGKTYTVQINKKLVDAAYYSNVIPLTHKRKYDVQEGVKCIPPNYLCNLAPNFDNFTVVGAGKTAVDCCLWLLEQGVDPARIRWIIPGDYWYFNRAAQQAQPQFFVSSFTSFIKMFDTFAEATNSREWALSMERSGLFMRLDSSIFPKQFHAATMSVRECEELRRIKDIVRKGHVTKIDAQQIALEQGVIETKHNTLYIDSTATCIFDRPSVPVFQPGKIVPQMIRYPLIPFSAAKVAFLESLDWSDEEKNIYAVPVRYPKNLDGTILSFATDLENRARELNNPALLQWLAQSRLDAFTRMGAQVRPEETDKLALLGKMQESFKAAYANMPKLVASLEEGAVYSA